MGNVSKRKSIRFKTDLVASINSFMDLTKNPDVEKVLGKNSISRSIKKAIWYLFYSFFDQRDFVSRGLFDRSLNELKILDPDLREKGYQLNSLNKAYSSGQIPDQDRLVVLGDIKKLLNENKRILEQFNKTFKI